MRASLRSSHLLSSTAVHVASKHVGIGKDDVDVMRWFAKLTYIHTDLYELVPLLDSYIFTDVLSATVEVECVPNPSREQVHFTVTSDDIYHLLTSSHINVYEARRTAIGTLLENRNTGAFMFLI